ncbi:AAA family ATPase [Microvirga sp. 2YAF29]|uniref:AAA family ATPase n=1 Tax=Microvirga sp. 2YAF29 TaxID=3233031 RepID=UPI003F9AF941
MTNDIARQARENGSSDPANPNIENSAAAAARARETLRIPRITIEAFCDTPDVAGAIENAARDRLMARTRVNVQMGGVNAAIEHYKSTATPNLVIIESRSSNDLFLIELDRLAEVCDSGTRLMAIGHANDIGFYRELIKRGVSEYALAPVDPVSLISSVSSIYGEASASKLGQTFAFIGAKGGVGSSTVAHNVASSISRRLSSDVMVADLDLPFGTASLDFNLDAGVGIAEAIHDSSRLDEVLLDRLLTQCSDHLSLLSAPAALERAYDLSDSAIEQLIEVAQASIPFTVLDVPHLWTSWAKNVLISADEIVVTAIPDLANLRNAKNIINVLKQARPHDPPPKLVLNQVGMPKRPEIKPKEFAKAVQLEAVACISFDAHLFGTAANKGEMIVDVSARSPSAKSFMDLADLLSGRQRSKLNGKRPLDLASLFGKLKRRP